MQQHNERDAARLGLQSRGMPNLKSLELLLCKSSVSEALLFAASPGHYTSSPLWKGFITLRKVQMCCFSVVALGPSGRLVSSNPNFAALFSSVENSPLFTGEMLMTLHHSHKHFNGKRCDFSAAHTEFKANSYKRLYMFLPILAFTVK